MGNPIENICAAVGSGADGSLDSNRLPSLAVAAGVASSSGKQSVSTSAATGIKVQQLYDDQETVDHKLSNHDFDRGDIVSQNTTTKPIPTRLPAIQNGGGSKTDLAGVAVKRSATSVIVPMSPETAMKLYMHKLSAFEQHEIFDYPKV